MGDRFDKLAKDAAADLPRREAFRRIGGGLLAVVLAAVGLAADNDKLDKCGKLCEICCHNNFSPPGNDGDGRAYAQCILDCHAGGGFCGPTACPGGLQG